MSYVVSVYICVVIVSVFGASCQLYEGSSCVGESDGVPGTCVHIRRCLAAVDEIKQKKYPQICSFRGRDPIICCTDCELVNDTSNVIVNKYGTHYFKTGRKAVDKCLEYAVALDYQCAKKTDGLIREKSEDFNCYVYQKPFTIAAVGGEDAEVGEYPHMALLGYGESLEGAQWLCGGSVISEKFILTAAHCLSSNSLGQVRYVALGILKRTDPPELWQRYSIKRIIVHPKYKPPSKYHDIALLEMQKKIQFSKIVLPVCLNVGDEGDESSAVATGWGALGHRKQLADTLQVVFLKQFTAEECSAAYPHHRHLLNGYDHTTQACYGDKEKIIDTCEGDSGGPLQISSQYGSCIFKVIGVTSYGRACGFPGGTGMYTRVAYYVPWIESVVWP